MARAAVGSVMGERLALGVSEVGRTLGVSTSLTRKLIREKKLPSVLVGDRRLVRMADLKAFLAARAGGGK